MLLQLPIKCLVQSIKCVWISFIQCRFTQGPIEGPNGGRVRTVPKAGCFTPETLNSLSRGQELDEGP